MASKHLTIREVARLATRDPQRSPLFHWLKDDFTHLRPLLSVPRVDWRPLLQAASVAGATDDKGDPASCHTAWRTWRKVCHVVAAEQAAQAAKPPQRQPALVRFSGEPDA